MLKTKKRQLKDWLQQYANAHKCYIGINSDYTPCVIAIWGKPKLCHNDEDGYWYWDIPNKKAKWEWLDNKIPEKLQGTEYKLMKNYKQIICPESVTKII